MANSKYKQLILGNSTRQDNRTYPPTMGSTPAAFSAKAGMAVMSADAAYNPGVAYAEGDLLFYTDGATVYDSTGAIMNSGTLNGLDGDNNGAQPAVIIKSSETHYYWILTLAHTSGKIFVSTVLMTGNSGRGVVTETQTITVGGASVGFITQGAAVSNRFNAFYSTATSQYGIITKLAGSNRWISHLITGVSSHLPVFAALVSTTIGSTYANNDAANHATVKFNEDNTKMATVYQAAVGTSGTPVLTALVEVYTLNPTTGVPSTFTSFPIPIRDAGAIAPGFGNDGRLKGYDLEWDFDTETLYVPTYDASHGLGISWYTVDASNVLIANGVVGKSQTTLGGYPDRAIFGMYKDPYQDTIYVANPVVTGTGGYSSDYNDTYSTNKVSVIRNTSTPASSEYTDVAATTLPGDTIGKGMPTRPISTEAVGASSYYTLTPCNAQREYVMDENGDVWVLNGALDATKIADATHIADRKNIAVQKETNFIYLLAGSGTSCKIHKINTLTGDVDTGTSLSDAGSSITSYDLIAGKDATSTDFIAMINTSGGHKYATIVIATGVTTPAGSAQAGITPIGMAVIGTNYFVTYLKRVYKNAAGTWSLLANTNAGLADSIKGLATDDTTLYGYVDGKRYTINQSTGEATAGKDITINASTGTWNYEVNGAGIVNQATLTTNDTNPGTYLNQVITVTNFSGCYTITTAGSGSTAIGTILSYSATCTTCSGIESEFNCKILVSCCEPGNIGIAYNREIVGVTDDVTINTSNVYEITGGNQTADQLNQCVSVENPDNNLYISFRASTAGRINLITGVISDTTISRGNDIAFNKHGVGFISTDLKLQYTIPRPDAIPSSDVTAIQAPQNKAISFNYSDELITAGIVGGVTQISRNTIDKKGALSVVNTLINTTVQLTGDLVVDKVSGNYYCMGDSSPAAVAETNDLFILDPSTLSLTVVASLTSTLSLAAYQNVRGIEIVKNVCYVVVENTRTHGLDLYTINKDTGVLIGTALPLLTSSGSSIFSDAPTGLGYNNPCAYWEKADFKVTSYSSCSTCSASTTSKNCCYELIDCVTGASTIVKTDISQYVGMIITTDTAGSASKCYTVYNYSTSSTCTGSDINVTSYYTSCTDCTGIQATCYRLLKCSDPTDDPKYTTSALTAKIKSKIGKVVVLEGETFCRTVDSAGNAVELNNAIAYTINYTRPSCTECNFFLTLKKCGSSNTKRYVDYSTSTTLHPWIGTGSVAIQDLGNGEQTSCWEIDSKIMGPTSTSYPTGTIIQGQTTCTVCNIQNLDSSAPQTYILKWCCEELNPGTYPAGTNQFFITAPEIGAFYNSGANLITGTIINLNGNIISGCWEISLSPGPVASLFLIPFSSVSINSIQNSTCENGCSNEPCNIDTNITTELLNCDVTVVNKYTPTSTFNTGSFVTSDLNFSIYNFSEAGLDGCWRRCTGADHIHGVNWFWGKNAGLRWDTLSYPSAAPAGASNMGQSDAELNSNSHFTKFGSTVHSAHEAITIGTKNYKKGDLFFYSDGRFVYNSSHLNMLGALDASGNPYLTGGVSTVTQRYASQQCVTVPKVDGGKFANTNTYKEYYLFYQKPLSIMFQYAVLSMDTADGLGEIISYNQDVSLGNAMGTQSLSSERLIVTSRPAIHPDTDDSYWLLDVEPFADVSPNTFGYSNIGYIRAWPIDVNGIGTPFRSPMSGTENVTGKITDSNKNTSHWAKIKISANNKFVALSGNRAGLPWTQIYKFNFTLGECTFLEERSWAQGIGYANYTSGDASAPPQVANCSNWQTDMVTGEDLGYETNFIPYTHGIEFGDNGLYTYVSGMSYPPNAWDCFNDVVYDISGNLNVLLNGGGGFYPWQIKPFNPDATPHPWNWSEPKISCTLLDDVTGTVLSTYRVTQNFSYNSTLPNTEMSQDCLDDNLTCGECRNRHIYTGYSVNPGTSNATGSTWPTVAPANIGYNGPGPSTFSDGSIVSVGQYTPTVVNTGPNPVSPMLQACIITDLHMGPDQHLYAGLVLGASFGVISNEINWRNSFLHIGYKTPDYHIMTGGLDPSGDLELYPPTGFVPNFEGTSYERIISGNAIQRWKIQSNVDGPIEGTPSWAPEQDSLNTFAGIGSERLSLDPPNVSNTLACNGTYTNVNVAINGLIDFGFPQYVRRQCYGDDLGAIPGTVQNIMGACLTSENLAYCGSPLVEEEYFKVSNCNGADCEQANADTCAVYAPGNFLQADNTTSRFGMTECLDNDIFDAIQDLNLGPQTVNLTYSFIKPGSTVNQSQYAQCTTSGNYTVPAFESGVGTANPDSCGAGGIVSQKIYGVTSEQFKDEVGKCFTEVKKLFEGMFSVAGGYPNQLTLNFIALVNASGVREETNVDSNVGIGASTTWSTSAPIGFSGFNGASGVGDFRIMMGRHKGYCLETDCTSGCTNCNNTGVAGAALAWAFGPGPDNVSGTDGVSDGTSAKIGRYRQMTFDINENWRKTTDAYTNDTFEILLVGTHEILHAMGFHHSFTNLSNIAGCDGPTTANYNNDFPQANCGTIIGGNLSGCGLMNTNCNPTGAQEEAAAAGDCIMGPFATHEGWTSKYGDGSAYNVNTCYQMGSTVGAMQDRAMVCQIYGFQSTYLNPTPNGNQCEPGFCPACVSSFYYTSSDLYDYLPGGQNGSFTWNPGSGLSCWVVELVQELPASVTTVVVNPATSYDTCVACELQFLPVRYRLVLCEECNEGVGSPAEIITSDTLFSTYCNTIDNPLSSSILQVQGYLGCYRVDCSYDPYENYIYNPIVSLPIIAVSENNCDTCCIPPSQCYTITKCNASGDNAIISFVVNQSNLNVWIGYTVRFQNLPADAIALGLSSDDCFTISDCGACYTSGCTPLVGAVLEVVNEFDTCYLCIGAVDVPCCKLTCCDNSGDTLTNVLPTADLASAAFFGNVVEIPQYPDSQGNPRCWHVTGQADCIPTISVTVSQSIASCILCNSGDDNVAGCMDNTATNYCPGCTFPCKDCCVYTSCPTSCLDSTALNYNPNASCDCSNVVQGTDYSCCQYPAVVVPPTGITPTFEKDCVNCLSWTEVDTVFSKLGDLCGSCFPPKGLTLKEYDCDIQITPGYIIPPVEVTGGCTNEAAYNYNPNAQFDDGSCIWESGCTDVTACNFNPDAVFVNNSECVYAGPCGCWDTSCEGCMDLLACNYDPDATVPNGSCEYSSCSGCMDPDAENYNPAATINDGSCVTSVDQCFDNRNIYVFYDMTSMGSGNAGTGATAPDNAIAFATEMKALFNSAMDLLLADIPNFSGNVYHMCVGGVNQIGGNNYYTGGLLTNFWKCGSSDIPANWSDYHVWDGLAGTSQSGGIVNSTARNTCSPWLLNTNPSIDSIPTNPNAPTAGGGFFFNPQSGGEQYLSWFQYPLHGNSNLLDPVNKIVFSNTVNRDKQTAGYPEFTNGSYTTAISGPLVKAFNSKGIDSSGNYINNLPGTQVNPFNDPAGQEGFSDCYHEFEGGDKNAICIAFIDESGGVYHQTQSQILNPSYCEGVVDTVGGICGPGSSVNTLSQNNQWTTGFIDGSQQFLGAIWKFDFMNFTRSHQFGYNLSSTSNVASIREPNSTDPTLGYSTGNFSGLVLPTKLSSGSNISNTMTFMHHLYSSIGQGSNVSASGHIPCADFVDNAIEIDVSASNLPSSTFNTDCIPSFKRSTDTNFVNLYTPEGDSSMPTSALTTSPRGATVAQNTFAYMGSSLSNYGVAFRMPNNSQSNNSTALVLGPQDIYEAVLAGLQCDYDG